MIVCCGANNSIILNENDELLGCCKIIFIML